MKANRSSMKAFTWDEWPFKIFFWINKTKSYTGSESLVVANYVCLHVWTLALGGICYGDKIGIFA